MRRARLLLGLLAAAFILLRYTLAYFALRCLGRQAPLAPTPRFHQLICWGLNLRVRVHGPAFFPSTLIVSNHLSWLDIPALATIWPMVFVAKSEVGGNFFGNALARIQGVVFVERRRLKSILRVNDEIGAALARGACVALFAEATTGDGNRLLRFRSSHFEPLVVAGAPAGVRSPKRVQPVFLRYSRLAGLPIGRAQMPVAAWYGNMTFLPHLRRYLSFAGIQCEIFIGQSFDISEQADRKLLAEISHSAVRALALAAKRGAGAIPAE